jgi:amidase
MGVWWILMRYVDEPEKYKNAPVSLQLVANRYQDEMLIEAAEYILEKIEAPWVKYV